MHGRKVVSYLETAFRVVTVPTAYVETCVLKLATKNVSCIHPQRIIVTVGRLKQFT
jgi:type II secretory ATPase GspE/PulE/Tfp pilus assembly ATPase PilB-like protein